MKKKPSHYQVFARLKASKIHIGGVGIFAIKKIKKGVYPFYKDDDRLVLIPKSRLKTLSRSIRKLYDDFCIIKGDSYALSAELQPVDRAVVYKPLNETEYGGR